MKGLSNNIGKIVLSGKQCNNNCIFCDELTNNRTYSTEELKNKIKNISINGINYISFSGGDFLNRKDCIEIIKYTKYLNFNVINIQTNGVLLDSFSFTEDIIKSGVNSVTVSIHGNNASLHDFITRNKGSFSKLISGIENLNKLKHSYDLVIAAKIVLTKQNHSVVHKIAKLLFKKNIYSCELALVKPIGEGFDKYKSLVPKLTKSLPYIRRYLEFGRKNFLTNWNISGVPYCLLMGYDDLIKNDDSFFRPQNNMCTKTNKCAECFYEKDCFGLSKTYDALFGDNELKNIDFTPERKKCLLIRPALYEPIFRIYELMFNEHSGYAMSNMQPSGLLKISSYLKSRGNYVIMVDSLSDLEKSKTYRQKIVKNKFFVKNIKCGNYENEGFMLPQYRFGYSFEKLTKNLQKLKSSFYPDDVYISTAMTYYYKTVHEAVKSSKVTFPKSKVTLGGIYASICEEHAKSSGADIVHVGEFKPASNMPTDLDVLDYDAKYAIIKSTRGCPNNCTYCAVSLLEGRKMKYRNVDYVVEDILEKYNDYGIRHFVFFESNLLLNMEKHFLVILDKIIESNIKITLHCPEGFEINKVTFQVAKKMKAAGFDKINLALESVDEEMLKRFHKPIKSMDLKGAVQNLKKAGINNINVFLLVGLPGQTLASIVRSYVYVWSQKCDIVFMPFTPIPGTIEYKNHYNLIKNKDLEELHPILLSLASNDLKLKNLYQLAMFEHTCSPEPMIYHLSQIDPESEVLGLITKYYYNEDKKIVDNYINNYKPKKVELEKLDEAKLFFDKKKELDYF